MKRRGVVTILALVMSFPVAAAENQSEQSLGSQQQTYTPSLAVVMELIQLSHFKLWLAGNLRNWPLAEYELSQMKATLQDARALFPNNSKADTSAISQSAEEFRDAIRTRDGAKFDGAFRKFTSECNSCHERVGLGFIKIKVPVTSPIDDLAPKQSVVCAWASPCLASPPMTQATCASRVCSGSDNEGDTRS